MEMCKHSSNFLQTVQVCLLPYVVYSLRVRVGEGKEAPL